MLSPWIARQSDLKGFRVQILHMPTKNPPTGEHEYTSHFPNLLLLVQAKIFIVTIARICPKQQQPTIPSGALEERGKKLQSLCQNTCPPIQNFVYRRTFTCFETFTLSLMKGNPVKVINDIFL